MRIQVWYNCKLKKNRLAKKKKKWQTLFIYFNAMSIKKSLVNFIKKIITNITYALNYKFFCLFFPSLISFSMNEIGY